MRGSFAKMSKENSGGTSEKKSGEVSEVNFAERPAEKSAGGFRRHFGFRREAAAGCLPVITWGLSAQFLNNIHMKGIFLVLSLSISYVMAQNNVLPQTTLQSCTKKIMGSYVCYYGYDDKSHLQLMLYKNDKLLIEQDYGEGIVLYSIDTCHVIKHAACDFLTVVNDENIFYFDLLSFPQNGTGYTVYNLTETVPIDVRMPRFNHPLYQLYALKDTNHDGYEDKLFIHILKNNGNIRYISGHNGTIKYDLSKIQK